MLAMKKFACLVLGLTFALMIAPNVQARIAPMRVVFISGSAEYESDKMMPILQKYLTSKYPSLMTTLNAKGDSIAGLEALEKCEVAVFFTRRLKLEGDQLERIKKYCTSGKPIVGIRTASHGVQTWLDFDKEVLGGNYKNHYKVGPVTEVKFVDNAKDHPILKGVPATFEVIDELYYINAEPEKIPPGTSPIEVLAETSPSVRFKKPHPVVWITQHPQARIVGLTLGHDARVHDLAPYQTLLTNAVKWASGK